MGKYNIERISQQIRIGWDGENNWRPQTFDCSSLLATRPSGTVTLWILPNGESEAFPVALVADGNLRTWTPLDSELVGGGGKLQFHCQSGTDVGKSPVYRYVVEGSLLTGAEHPDETPSWAVQVVEDVTEAASHYPYIGENGNWFVWDTTEGEFVDTGVSAGGGEISPEDVAEAVEDYMDEHPVTEADPTVPAWAKQPQKPSYTASEVGALPADTVIPSVPQMAAQADMSDWTAGKTVDAATLKTNFAGAMTLLIEKASQTQVDTLASVLDDVQTAVSDKANISDIPTKTSNLTNDSNYQTAQQVQTAIANLQTKSITDTGGYYTTDTVEGALQEIGAELGGKADKVAITASDNGKFMRVVNGAWAAATVPSAESASFGGGST